MELCLMKVLQIKYKLQIILTIWENWTELITLIRIAFSERDINVYVVTTNDVLEE